MPFYYQSGQIPHKRHTQFRKPDGSLYAEQLVSTEGFSDNYSLVYHCYPPTLIKSVEDAYSVKPGIAIEKNIVPGGDIMISPGSAGVFFRTAGCYQKKGQDDAVFEDMLYQAGSGI